MMTPPVQLAAEIAGIQLEETADGVLQMVLAGDVLALE